MAVILAKRATGSIPLPGGVKLTVKHADAAVFELAERIAAQDARKMKEGQLAAAAYGLDEEAMKAAGDAPPLATMTTVALARLTITAWEGVEVEIRAASGDQPALVELAPVEPASIAMLMNATALGGLTYGHLFNLAMRGRSMLEPSAKNGSTVSPDMNTGEAVNGAANAGSPGIAEKVSP